MSQLQLTHFLEAFFVPLTLTDLLYLSNLLVGASNVDTHPIMTAQLHPVCVCVNRARVLDVPESCEGISFATLFF